MAIFGNNSRVLAQVHRRQKQQLASKVGYVL